MPPKSSRIWNTFKEKEGDPSTAICQIAECRKKEISRGKKGTPNHFKNMSHEKFLILLKFW